MSALIRPDNASHWYTKTGEPCHEVPAKKGGMKSTTIKEAREMNLLPSVTNILGVVAKPNLTAWLQTQAIMHALTTPRVADESEDDFARRMVSEMKSEHAKAPDLGTRIHAACELWAVSKTVTPEADLIRYQEAFAEWLETAGEVIWAEKVLIGSDYAGKADLLIEHKELGPVLVDLKSQDVKNGKPSFYDEWCWQNAAYANCVSEKTPMIGNLIIDKTEPGRVHWKLWTREEQDAGFTAFQAAKVIWQIQKGYAP